MVALREGQRMSDMDIDMLVILMFVMDYVNICLVLWFYRQFYGYIMLLSIKVILLYNFVLNFFWVYA